MLLPKIEWNDGTTHTLIPTYPPVQKPGVDERVVTRPDTIAVSGIKQSAWLRTDVFRTVQFTFVPFSDYDSSGGTDGWSAFFAWAETGAPFTYYPDSTVGSDHDDWTLESTDWLPEYVTHSHSKFTFKMRKKV